MAVVNILKHSSRNPRINGIRTLRSILTSTIHIDSLDTINAWVVTESTFLYFLKNGTFSLQDTQALRKILREQLIISPTKKLVVRRAFVVPSLESPPGPRFLGLQTVNEAMEAIRKVFQFAIKHQYYKEKGSKIEAFFYPFVDPPILSTPIKDGLALPKGGYAVSLDTQARHIRVVAVFGNNEGVQSLTGVDEYIVDAKSLIITKKIIPQKEEAICTTKTAQDDKVLLPLSYQFEQVLSDWDILSIARVVKEATKIAKSTQRIEFSYDGKKLSLNELVDYGIEYLPQEEFFEIQGNITVVARPRDLKKIDIYDSQQILYIDREVVKKRDFDTLNAIAGLKRPLVILYPGTTTTAHAMRVLVDAGHHAFVVGNKVFSENEQIEIGVKEGIIHIKKIGQEKITQNIIDLAAASTYPLGRVGGKAYNLSRLILFGYRVPTGHVISSRVMGDNAFFKTKEFQHFLETLDSNKKYAVRSSADIEDSSNNAFAGQFESYLHVKPNNIEKAIKNVWKSANTTHVKKLLKSLKITRVKMGVVVHEMVDPVFGGVIFGANIETKNTNQVVIEITDGYASGVVDGTATVKKIIVDKTLRKILHSTGNTIRIQKKKIETLIALYLRLEDNFRSMQDVEWGINKKGELFVLQTRALIV